MFKKLQSLLLAFLLFISACSLETKTDEPVLSEVYVMNEGSFGNSNASVSSYDPVSGNVASGIFESVNGRVLGDVLNSFSLIDGKLFLVVNNSNKIEVVDPESFTSIATIDIKNQKSPRHIVKAGEGKAYVTNLYGNNVSIIDLNTYTETGVIPVGQNPEGIAVVGSRAFVANSGFGSGNTVSVIETSANQVIRTVEVGDNPVGLKVDRLGRVWVVCVGAYNDFSTPDDDTPGQIYLLDGGSGDVLQGLTVGGHPGRLALNPLNDKAYLLNGGVMEIDMTNLSVTNEMLIEGGWYSVDVDPESEQPSLWLTDPKNYNQNGEVVRYDFEGNELSRFSAGLIPGGLYFHSR